MAITNAEVARRFALFMTTGGETPKGKGGQYLSMDSGNMRAYAAQHTPGIFTLHAFCNSYSTRVAALVWNTWAKRYELWLDPMGYNPTTGRHKSDIRGAYDAQCRTLGVTPHVFTVDPDWVDRSKPAMLTTERKAVVRIAAQADMPRIQERTRYTALSAAVGRIDALLHLMMDGLPAVDDPGTPAVFGVYYDTWRHTIAHYQNLRSTITGFAALPIDQMRPCVRGWAEMHKMVAGDA